MAAAPGTILSLTVDSRVDGRHHGIMHHILQVLCDDFKDFARTFCQLCAHYAHLSRLSRHLSRISVTVQKST